MGRISCQIIVLIFLVAFSLSCVAQGEKSATSAKTQSNSQTAPFAGCYDLKLGRWWPWGFGEDTIFVTPPGRIKLLPEHGTEGFEQYGFVIREMTPGKGAAPYRRRYSYWEVKATDQIDMTWTTGFSGVTLELKKQGNNLRGWAHPFWDFPRLSRVARVTAQQIACDAAQ